ncbi:MAG: hypothetical protein WDZ83_01215 [Rhizobiaceae bacterium]
MTRKLCTSALLSLAIASAILAGTQASQASPPFDGRWTVTVSAEGENCSSRRGVPINVAAGQVRYAGLFGVKAEGRVRPDGDLTIRFAHRKDVVKATGALEGNSGSGSWVSPTRDCSGTWVARKT